MLSMGHENHVTADDEAGTITVKGKTIKIYAEKPMLTNCPWKAKSRCRRSS